MEGLTVHQFAEERGLGETQVRRILEHPERYAWARYGIAHAQKVGRAWRIRLKEQSMAVEAQGSAKLVDELAWTVSSYEKSYPMAQLLADLQTLPLGQVVGNVIKHLPQPAEAVGRLARIAREGPPPDEVLLRAQPFFR